jgi:hypothetical protein
MMKTISVPGRCRCQRVTFVLREEPFAFYLCHCTDCQAESGSAFGQSMHIRRDAVDGVEGEVLEHTSENSDGRRFVMTFCENCRTMLFGYSEEFPQVLGLNAGSLEAAAGFTPYGNMWTSSARPWVKFAPGPRFERDPEDPLAMIHAWQGRPQQD